MSAVCALGVAGCGSRTDAPDAAAPVTQASAATGSTSSVSTSFGTLASPCGPNTTGQVLAAGDTGLTADSVTITTISDPGGAKPGLNQGVFDSMQAFTDWCNEQGGINGRKIILEQRDAKLSDYKNQVLAACQDSFALVGGVGVFDDLGVDDARACGLVNVPAGTPGLKSTNDDRTIQVNPISPTEYPVGAAEWVKTTYPDAPRAAGAFYSNVPLVEYQNRKWVEAYKLKGFDFVQRTAANLNETAWGPLVVQMKNGGVKYLALTSTFEDALPMQKEFNAQGYVPDVLELQGNFYDSKYPEQAKAQGIDLTNTFINLTIPPFEEADSNPATKAYLDALAKSVPDAQPTLLGVYAFSAGLMFATALKDVGPNPTREQLLTQLRMIHRWDAGGLQAPADPAGRHGASCFVMLEVTQDGFERAYPLPDKDKAVYDNTTAKGLACLPDSVVTFPDPPKPAG